MGMRKRHFGSITARIMEGIIHRNALSRLSIA